MERQHTSELWGPNRPQKIGENLSSTLSLDASESDLSDGTPPGTPRYHFPVANLTFRCMLKSGLSPQGLGADWGRIGVGGGGGTGAEHLEKSISGGGLGRRGYEGNVFPEVSVWKISNFLRKTIVSSKQKEADPQPIFIFGKIGTENLCFGGSGREKTVISLENRAFPIAAQPLPTKKGPGSCWGKSRKAQCRPAGLW